MTPTPGKSTATLLGDIVGHMSRLVRHEVDLARAEVGENLNRAALGLGLVMVAFLLALVALNVLAAALVAAIAASGLTPGASALIVGGVLLAAAAILAAWGLKAVRPSNIAPKRTVANLRRDAGLIREKLDA